jgi:nucleotide-binding universal stress UspA family protein
MSIVYATDFSDAAKVASHVVAELAHKAGKPLYLVHVVSSSAVLSLGRPCWRPPSPPWRGR